MPRTWRPLCDTPHGGTEAGSACSRETAGKGAAVACSLFPSTCQPMSPCPTCDRDEAIGILGHDVVPRGAGSVCSGAAMVSPGQGRGRQE